MLEPLVLEIKGNSLDDGPGIRSAVFFKGCPLDCIWCHNPESKSLNAEISYDKELCICDWTCQSSCKFDALIPGADHVIDRTKCTLCFECTKVCPAKALSQVGTKMSHEELFKKLVADKMFYDVSGGGVTLSGGEPTMCTEWVGELAKMLFDNGISVLIETCGLFDYDKVKKFILPFVKNIYCDLKIFDSENHKKYCGVDNTVILDNIKKLNIDGKELGFDLLVRTPLIPGVTDMDENLISIAEFLSSIGINRTQLLPYNPTWYHKSEKIGATVDSELKEIKNFQTGDILEHAKQIYTSRGITCVK